MDAWEGELHKITSGCSRANVANFIFCHFWPGPQEKKNGLSLVSPSLPQFLPFSVHINVVGSRQFIWIKEAFVGNFGDLKMLYNFFPWKFFFTTDPWRVCGPLCIFKLMTYWCTGLGLTLEARALPCAQMGVCS